MKRVAKRILSFITALALVIAGLTMPEATKVKAYETKPGLIMVSLGDSYSSGEGIVPFYCNATTSAEKVKDKDWLAHRSQKAWPGKLKINGIEMERGVNWFFEAASGAETVNLTQKLYKEYDYDGLNSANDENAYLRPQLEVFEDVKNKYGSNAVDFVTVTIGGNDVGFVDIILAAVNPNSEQNLDELLSQVWTNFNSSHNETIGGQQVSIPGREVRSWPSGNSPTESEGQCESWSVPSFHGTSSKH